MNHHSSRNTRPLTPSSSRSQHNLISETDFVPSLLPLRNINHRRCIHPRYRRYNGLIKNFICPVTHIRQGNNPIKKANKLGTEDLYISRTSGRSTSPRINVATVLTLDYPDQSSTPRQPHIKALPPMVNPLNHQVVSQLDLLFPYNSAI
ncbi:hypothetical protein PGTUg99_009970 [Puccinia graminis f. sp. tritici]|uniref:Uncharacterized protein n=1 Tax=Puccinia graminis f. sp. tritici TaxID=56615 RepID=A0A5B0LIG4_PUCGR|nr:hypothetical protein PGTUg99_009970 [Puccinia graminis f. sp. tritici]